MRRPGDQRSTRSAGQASPATTSETTPGSVSFGGRAASTDGGRVTWVTRRSASRSSSPAPGSSRSPGAMTRAAPASQVTHISETDASKLGEASWSTRLSPVTANRSACAAASAARPVWETTTPFGVPVEPEVWITYAGWAGRRPVAGSVSGYADRSRRSAAASRTRAGAVSARTKARRSAG